MSPFTLIAVLITPPLVLGTISLLTVRNRLGPAYAVRNKAGKKGAEVAQKSLARLFPVDTCRVASFDGRSFDHYSPSVHCVSLHTSHYTDDTIAAVAAAAHQSALAGLCEEGKFGSRLRQTINPLTVCAAQLLPVAIALDLYFDKVAYVGILLAAIYLLLAVLQLATLGLEFAAARRAKTCLHDLDFLTEEELSLASQALAGMVWAYPASLVSSWLNLHHSIVRAGFDSPSPALRDPADIKRVRPRYLGPEIFSKS